MESNSSYIFTRCNVIDDNVAMFHGKIPYERLHTLTFTHHAMLLTRKLTPARFSSWCIVIDDNVAVLDEKLHYECKNTLDFTYRAMI